MRGEPGPPPPDELPVRRRNRRGAIDASGSDRVHRPLATSVGLRDCGLRRTYQVLKRHTHASACPTFMCPPCPRVRCARRVRRNPRAGAKNRSRINGAQKRRLGPRKRACVPFVRKRDEWSAYGADAAALPSPSRSETPSALLLLETSVLQLTARPRAVKLGSGRRSTIWHHAPRARRSSDLGRSNQHRVGIGPSKATVAECSHHSLVTRADQSAQPGRSDDRRTHRVRTICHAFVQTVRRPVFRASIASFRHRLS